MDILESFKNKNLDYEKKLSKNTDTHRLLVKEFEEKFEDLNKRKRILEGEEIALKKERWNKLTDICNEKTELIENYYKGVRKIGYVIWLEKNGVDQFTLKEEGVRSFVEERIPNEDIVVCERVYSDVVSVVFRVGVKFKTKAKRKYKNYYVFETKLPWVMLQDFLKEINVIGISRNCFCLFPTEFSSTSVEGLNRKWKKFKRVLGEICYMIYEKRLELGIKFWGITEKGKEKIIGKLMKYEEIREVVEGIGA